MQNLNRPNLLQRIRAVFRPPGLLQPAQQQSSRMPDLERWTMPHRSVDMQDWTVARNMATNVLHPDRSRLMDLYDSILVDSHLASTMETRVLRVVRSRFRLMKDGEARPELLHHLETPWFEDFLRYVAEAAFRGHTLIELGQLARPGELKEVNRIDPRNVLPWSGIVVRRQGEETGYNYREAPLNAYLIEVGRPDDLGLLCDVGPVAIIKKYAVGSWSDYVHKYGIPPRWVKTNSRDARRFKQLETMMQNMLSSAYGVIEGDEEIQIMQTPGTDAHKVFNELISRMNSEISKRLLGQDGTTDNKDASGTYGSLKVLQGVAEDRHAADKASVGYVINQELLPRLTALGYPFAGVRFEWDGLRDLAPMELVDAVSKLGMVMDIDPEYIEERTGIRILGARRMPGEMGGNWPGWPGGGGNPPGNGRQGGGTGGAGGQREEEDDDDEDGDGITAQWPRNDLGRCGICGGSRMPDITAEAGLTPLSDEDADQVLREIEESGGIFSQRYFSHTADTLVPAFGKAWEGGTPVNPDAIDTVAHTVMEANVYRFSGIKTRALAMEINEIARTSKGFEDFKQRVKASGKFGKFNRWRHTEYANAVNSGMQASRYYSMKDRADALPYWRYETMEDGRVRQAHANLNNKVFRHDDPIWNTIYPPNGWRCRCYVTPIDDDRDVLDYDAHTAEDFLGTQGLDQLRRSGHDVNRARIGEVFKLDGAYRTENSKKVYVTKNGKKVLADPPIGYKEAYGEEAPKQTYKAIMDRMLPEAPEGNATKEAARHALFPTPKTKSITMSDYAGRPFRFNSKTFDHHMSGDYKDQHRYRTSHLIGEVLSTPDEVWLSFNRGTGKATYTYIRYYQGNPVAVQTKVALNKDGNHTMAVHTWFELTEHQSPSTRQGLLLKRNAR